MENQEIYYIEESQAWVCPIAGRWKIIAVGGGASGGYLASAGSEPVAPVAGGTTSFGSIIAADGGKSIVAPAPSAASALSGYGGYNGISYGGGPVAAANSNVSSGVENSGVPSTIPTTAIGYGAGGGTYSYGSGTPQGIPGRAGDIKTAIVTLTEGENIPCTIGKGGETADAVHAASGADGVIILQYLGV